MRVGFCIRPEYNSFAGGDVVQMLKTKAYIEQNFSVEIEIISSPNNLTNDFDIVHVFNFSTYKISKEFIEQAKSLNIPVVSSSIYWDYSFASTAKLFCQIPKLNQLNEFTIGILKHITKVIAYIINKPEIVSPRFKRNAKWMYENSDIVAPNSLEEAGLLLKWIKSNDEDKIRVVYNAAEKSENKANIDENLFHQKYNIPKDYILQVGRIEFCKNQLNLVYALRNDKNIPIVFVGKITDEKYYTKIKKIANRRGNVFFIDAVPYNEIGMFYKFARLHVLLSLRESPGLVSIEALANSCPIVISDERFLPLNTYFKNQPYIANPLNIRNIRSVVLEAYQFRKLEPFDFLKFSWNNVADQTYKIYLEIINKL